ncbi:helix-turn-helix transcriptional regulator [Gangjinia marincola]|uniref:Helix-turn-helix transcriptional regulator n=1 Tax=Gangjinia marincola TaxID=578463 RepID=A0ABN1MD89_9FLAO
MVNSEKFAARLEEIFSFYELNASSFSDKIEVGRSSISHIISGRNKPSLDFIMKVVETFPEVDLYWLLNGKGSFPKSGSSSTASGVQQTISSSSTVSENTPAQKETLVSNPNVESVQTASTHLQQLPRKGKTIEKIIVLYTDGSFDSFEN